MLASLLVVLGAAAAPGMLAGAQLTALLFFLNPHLPFDLATFSRGLARYASLLGAVSILAHLPFTWGRTRRARRALPWTLAAVLAISALAAWRHAAFFAYYLPPGINRSLLKSALWLSLGTLVCFYTALLHTVRARPYGRRSQALLAAIALASVWAAADRRGAFRPPAAPEPRPALTEERPARVNLWVVGVETATLDAILPLVEQGRLPFLRAALEGGASARLTTIAPVRRTPLWTTLASGTYPHRHGLVGPTAYDADFLAPEGQITLLPQGLGFDRWGLRGARARPASRLPRASRALWEVLSRVGIATGVVAWPAVAAPPEASLFGVAERFFGAGGGAANDEGLVHPPEWRDRARLFRVAPSALDSATRSRLGPGAPESVMRSLAGDVARESLALALRDEHVETGAVFLYLPGFFSVTRNHYGGFSRALFDGSDRREDRDAERLVVAYLQHLDGFLAEVWRRMPSPRLLVVTSAFGVEAASGWRSAWSKLRRRDSQRGFLSGEADGMWIFYGDPARPGARLRDARIVDLAPTLAYAVGAPIARDLDGEVLTGAFNPAFLAAQPMTFVGSYERLSARRRGRN